MPPDRAVIEAYSRFFAAPPPAAPDSEPEAAPAGATEALALFHEAARRVPAYAHFLAAQG